jgi:glycosyltransferase involved in cell wall biosynthesis
VRAVFLVINYMPHQVVSMKAFIKYGHAEVHAFHFKENTEPPESNRNLKTYSLTQFSRIELLDKIKNINPEIMVVAGWAVSEFVWVAKKIKQELGIPVVTYSDTQWLGTWRQRINTLISPYHLKKAFSHAWVSGIYQFEYARRLGFNKRDIIYNALSCDVELFNKVSITAKREQYPKNILFIGRFVQVKGLDLLLEAWSRIKNKNGWTLTLVGDGPMKKSFINYNDIVIKDYMPQSMLINEMQNAGCFVLPSTFEPWALVIHEAAAAGMPLVVTDKCGAAPHFVIDGYNGYRVGANVNSLQKGLEKIINADTHTLLNFSERSKKLSNRITPEIGSAELLSVLD